MQKYSEIKSGGLTLRGMVHIPETGKKLHPFAVMYHGFTGNRLEAQGNFVRLSQELEALGIGSARFDFSGSGESGGKFEDMTASGEIAEAKMIFDFVRNSDFADNNNLIILGMSMGGLISSLIAYELPGLKSMVLWAPAGNMKNIIDLLIKVNPHYGDNIETNGVLFNKKLLDDLKKYDPFAAAKKFSGNVLIVHGTRDTAVPLKVPRQYRESFPGKCSLVEIRDADHTFSKLIWKNKLIETTKEFLLKELRSENT